MHRLVCIEGPDGAGKTSLIEGLRDNSKRYFAAIKASAPPPDNIGSLFTKAAINFSRSFPYPVVLDRCHPISEAIYAAVIRGTVMPTIAQIQVQLLEFDMFVYCRPPTPIIKENLKSNPQMAGVIEKIDDIIELYDYVMGRIANVYRYDYTAQSIEYVRERIFNLPSCARCRSFDHHVSDCPL